MRMLIAFILVSMGSIRAAEDPVAVFRRELQAKIDERVVVMLKENSLVRMERIQDRDYYNKKIAALAQAYAKPLIGAPFNKERALMDADSLITCELDGILSRDPQKIDEWSKMCVLTFSPRVKKGLEVKDADIANAKKIMQGSIAILSEKTRAIMRATPIAMRKPPWDQTIVQLQEHFAIPFESAPFESRAQAGKAIINRIISDNIDISIDVAARYFSAAGNMAIENIYFGCYGTPVVLATGQLTADKAEALVKEAFVTDGKIDASDAPAINLFVLQRMQLAISKNFIDLFPGKSFTNIHEIQGVQVDKAERQEIMLGKP